MNSLVGNFYSERDNPNSNPELNTEISDQDWDNFVYYRKNPRGNHLELWHHISGCRQWFKVLRNTATHDIIQTMEMKENP